MLAVGLLTFASCPNGEEGEAQLHNHDDRPVINTLWCEGEWQDPRITMGYQLEDCGKNFFDRYVMLYGGRIYNRNCATNPEEGVDCRRVGLHLHHGQRCGKILREWQTYIKPIQDKGIKFIMSLVPAGGGIAHGGFYSWPMEDVAPWAELYPASPEYPFGEEATQRFIDQIVEAAELYNLDGIAFDDEYANMGSESGKRGLGEVYPSAAYYDTSEATNAAWERGGKNMLRFAYEVKKQVKEKLNRDFAIECYEIRYGAYMPYEMEYDGKRVRLHNVLDITYAPWYGGFTYPSGSGLATNHMRNSQYGPLAIDIGSATAGTAPKPASTESGIIANVQQVYDGEFGAIMYFSAVSRRSWREDYPAGYFGQTNDPCEYFSKISRILWGENVIYTGDDYELDW
jgi:hypothetical protein